MSPTERGQLVVNKCPQGILPQLEPGSLATSVSQSPPSRPTLTATGIKIFQARMHICSPYEFRKYEGYQ